MQTEQGLQHFRRLLGRKSALYAGMAAVVMVFSGVLVCLLFLSNSLNGYLEKRIVKEFTKQYPTCSLKISGFKYNLWKNRIGWDSLVLQSVDSGFACNLGTSKVSGIGWLQLIWKGKHPAKALSYAIADAQDIGVKLPHSNYRFSCKRLHLSMPDGEMTAGVVDFKPLVDDEQYFAGSKYRSTRVLLTIPECSVTGLDVPEFLEGKGYRTQAIQLHEPSFDMLVDMYAPVDPKISDSRMPNEMLNSSHENIQIKSLKIVNGKLKYGEIYAHGTTPAIVTFDDLQLQAEGIANHGKPEDTAVVKAQAIFMQGGVMKLDLAVPLSSPEFSLQYSGSLSAMEINRLNPFLEHSEYLRIDSGVITQTITYNVQVISGQSSGVVKAEYQDLKVSILNKETGSSHDIINEIKSYMMSKLKIRHENIPGMQGALHIGKVEYKRGPKDTFIQFLWFSLRSGVLNVLFM